MIMTPASARIVKSSLILLLSSFSACAPTYSPPARAAHYGAPAKFHRYQAEAGAGVAVGVREAYLAYAPLDQLQIELGAHINGEGTSIDKNGFWMIYNGLRLSPFPITEQKSTVKFLWDIETGGGAGQGGEYCGNDPEMDDPEDDCTWDGLYAKDRQAIGYYIGTGIGMNIHFFDLYGRYRYQIAKAKNIPTTYWWTALVGLQFTIIDHLKLHLGYGEVGYSNSMDEQNWGLWEIGLGFNFDLFDTSKN